jgi:N-acyl-D-amino-acid deacylase
MFDTLITNGTVVDGSGSQRFQADVAITDGRIVGIGDLADQHANETIDALGCLVTPGWVDVHTHYDGQATWDPVLAPSSWHGVTTVVMGNCGVGFAPVRPDAKDFLIQLMEGVEDIPGTALAEGINWQWEHFPEYLDALEGMPRAIDVATQVPHAAVRAYVMGERCNTDDQPTSEDLQQMAQIVKEGIAAGALGFSTSRTLLHKDVHGVDVPGTHAPKEEMMALGLALKDTDHGVFELVSDHLGKADEREWVMAVAREIDKPVTLVWTSPEAFEGDNFINLARSGAAEGLKILPQVAARPTGILHGLQSSFHVFVGHPTWYTKIAPLPFEQQLQKLQDPETRTQMLAEDSAIAMSPFGLSWANLLWHVFPLGENPNYEPTREQSVAGIAAAQDRDSFEVMYDLLVANAGEELFYQPLNAYDNYDLSFFENILTDPDVLFGLSDGGAHCGVIADAGMPTFVLSHWARDRNRGPTLELELLVKKLSRDTAMAYGMNDRGLLAEGLLADINIIDFEQLRLHRPQAIFDLPTGGRRLVQRAEGYKYVLKSGVTTFVEGQHTGALPGQLVRGGSAH